MISEPFNFTSISFRKLRCNRDIENFILLVDDSYKFFSRIGPSYCPPYAYQTLIPYMQCLEETLNPNHAACLKF